VKEMEREEFEKKWQEYKKACGELLQEGKLDQLSVYNVQVICTGFTIEASGYAIKRINGVEYAELFDGRLLVIVPLCNVVDVNVVDVCQKEVGKTESEASENGKEYAKKYTNIEKLKIIERSKYIKIVNVKKKEELKPDDVYIPIKKGGKIRWYIVAVNERNR